jgi:hypothetical protein
VWKKFKFAGRRQVPFMIRVLTVALICMALAACDSETYTEVKQPRAHLLPGFESYESLNEVRAKLPSNAEVEVIEDNSLAKDTSKPPYRMQAISVAPYRHLERPGRLVITFYNDRLLQTAFYPDRLDEYILTLRHAGINLGYGQQLVNGNTVIWIGTDFDNKQYVAWADKRLREQQRRWLANYQ